MPWICTRRPANRVSTIAIASSAMPTRRPGSPRLDVSQRGGRRGRRGRPAVLRAGRPAGAARPPVGAGRASGRAGRAPRGTRTFCALRAARERGRAGGPVVGDAAALAGGLVRRDARSPAGRPVAWRDPGVRAGRAVLRGAGARASGAVRREARVGAGRGARLTGPTGARHGPAALAGPATSTGRAVPACRGRGVPGLPPRPGPPVPGPRPVTGRIPGALTAPTTWARRWSSCRS